MFQERLFSGAFFNASVGQEMSNGLTMLNNDKGTNETSIKLKRRYFFIFFYSTIAYTNSYNAVLFLFPVFRLQHIHDRCYHFCISHRGIAGGTFDRGEFQLIKIIPGTQACFECIAVAYCPLHRWSSQISRDRS